MASELKNDMSWDDVDGTVSLPLGDFLAGAGASATAVFPKHSFLSQEGTRKQLNLARPFGQTHRRIFHKVPFMWLFFYLRKEET